MTMSDPNSEQVNQTNMIGGEVMEVMMTGGDIGEMNEETVAQVVNMLQMEGQLTSGNNTIIIRQPGSDEIQMIQTSNNCGELIVSKTSEAEIQALQAGNGILANVNEKMLEGEQGQVVMMDEGGNLVEGVVQMPDEGVEAGVVELDHQVAEQELLNTNKNEMKNSTEILNNLVDMSAVHSQDNLMHTNGSKPITISTTTGKPKPKLTSGLNGEVVSIKINTGLSTKKKEKPRMNPQNVIKISTVTGQQKYQPPKFHKCEACAINFVSKVAYMNHMENCPSKKKALSNLNKGNVTYTCVFCETKFTSRLVLMQHVRTCDKAKSSKNLSTNSKLKVTTSESKLKLNTIPDLKGLKGSLNEKTQKSSKLSDGREKKFSKKSILDPEDEMFSTSKFDSEDEEDDEIVYDDEEDFNDEDLMGDDKMEETITVKRSQKHLGPILIKGMFKCRDCSRTFSKEHQYNRHVKACTNAPLNAARIDADEIEMKNNTVPVGAAEALLASPINAKRKRGRPPLKDYGDEDGQSPSKKRALGPKIVSVNPKNIGAMRDKSRLAALSDNESDEDILNYLSGGLRSSKDSKFQKTKSLTASNVSSHSKVVKISPSDTLIKQTSKAILNKMNKEKYAKLFKETPFCGLCGDKFKLNKELSLHTQICHSEDLLNLRDSLDGKGNMSSQKCPLCDLHFVSPHMLLLHIVSSHEQDLKTAQDVLENQNLHLVCPFCFDISFTQDLLKEHLATKHLDKWINKPSGTVSPIAIDIHALLKEKNNGSLSLTSEILAKKEKVLCPDCGLYFLKTYFEHHRCAADTHSSSARKFVCSESQCSGLSFFKLIHLLTHLQQVHDKYLPCCSMSFESLTHFLDWLKKEEVQTKMKYTRAFQRMKQGKLCTVWICHRFHNAMKDSEMRSSAMSSESKQESNRLNHCYSRIHTETSFNNSTSRYDGETSISYYPEHKHPHDSESKPARREPVPHPQPAPLPIVVDPLPTTTTSYTVAPPIISSTFSDAAELKQLLEDDDDFDRPVDKESDFDSGALVATLDALEKDVKAAASQDSSSSRDAFGAVFDKETVAEDDAPSVSLSSSSLQQHGSQEDSLRETLEQMDVEEGGSTQAEIKESKLDCKDKDVSGLINFSETDLLLEKMLGEHETSGGPEAAMGSHQNVMQTVPETVAEGPEDMAPTVDKVTDVDMLEAFGGCLTPEEASNSSAMTESLTEPQKLEEDAPPMMADGLELSPDVKNDGEESTTKDCEDDENTYVLPADVEEWSKLFELVSSQLASNSISNEEESEAKSLLAFESDIMNLPVEKQIEVFNRLCSLANVQMT